MPEYTAQQPEPFISFEAGIDRENARTFLDRTLYGAYSLYHAYEDAQNILLQSVTSGKHPTSIAPDIPLDSIVTWPPGNVNWFGAFTQASFVGGVLTQTTHLVIMRSDGSAWRYDAGAPGINTLVRRGFTTATNYVSHMTYNQWLVIFDGVDAPMKYAQHLNYDNQNEPRPFMIPVGAKLVTPFVNSIYKVAGEVWTLGGSSAFTADAAVPNGGARSGPETLKVDVSAACTLVYTASTNGSASTFTQRDLQAPPQPYSAQPNFTGSDFLIFQYFKSQGIGNLTIEFGTDNTFANSFKFTVVSPTSGSWQTARLLRSSATTVGAADWTKINAIRITNLDTAFAVFIDDMYMLYANAPPALKIGEAHKDRIIGAGVASTATTLSTLYWSNAQMPDTFPAANTQFMTSSQRLLTHTNQVTALREYGDQVVVGLPDAILSWTIGTDGNPVKSTITTVFGIDAHRGMVETPSGTLAFQWERGLYMLRATARQYISAKINPLLVNMEVIDPSWTIGVLDEKTKSIRFWMRSAGSTQTQIGIIYDYVRAQERGEPVWPSTMSQMADFATPINLNGVREIMYSQFNSPQIFRMGAGTGAITSYITFPWMSRGGRDKLDKVIGMIFPVSNSAPIQVFCRFAQHPGEFDNATFKQFETIQPTTGAIPGPGQAVQQARATIGRTARWFQIKLVCNSFGFELFPPVEVVALESQRVP